MKSAKITDYFSKKTPSAPIVDNTAPKEKAENSVYLDDMASVLLSRHPNRDHPFFAKRLKQQPKSNDSNFRVRKVNCWRPLRRWTNIELDQFL